YGQRADEMKVASAPLLSICALTAITIAAQTPRPPSNGDYQYQFPGLEDPKLQSESYPTRRTAPPSEPRVVTKGPLTPAQEDRLKSASFLSQSNTGLARLLPQTSSSADPTLAKIRGGGAFYSFFHRTHEYGFGSDLSMLAQRPATSDDHAGVFDPKVF